MEQVSQYQLLLHITESLLIATIPKYKGALQHRIFLVTLSQKCINQFHKVGCFCIVTIIMLAHVQAYSFW